MVVDIGLVFLNHFGWEGTVDEYEISNEHGVLSFFIYFNPKSLPFS